MSQDTGGDIDEIPEEYLTLRTEEAGKAAREALRIRSWNPGILYLKFKHKYRYMY